MKIEIQKIHEDSKVPAYSYEGDAAFDLYSYGDFIIPPGERASVATGIKLAIPEGHAGLVWDKSGLAFNFGIKTMGGVIDSGYRGEVKVGVINLSKETFHLKSGDKVAQMIIQKVEHGEIVEVAELDTNTHRGEKGFGSSGK